MRINNRFKTILLKMKPWAIYLGVFLILRFTGLLSGISDAGRSALLQTGLMDANTEEPMPKNAFDYEFTLLNSNQKAVEMTKFKGKTIFINVWATWCGPCRAEMPSIQSLYGKVDPSKVEFVMLSLDQQDRFNKVAAYIGKNNFTFPIFYPDENLPALLQVRSIPTTFVISPGGEVVYQHAGTANYDTEKFKTFLEGL